MKKLLSFLVAGAIALGLIGCAGDMHDDLDPSSIKYGLLFGTKTILDDAGIIGLNDVWSDDSGEANRGNPLTKVDDTTYTYTFEATKQSTQFCIQESRAAKWTKPRWCGFATSDNAQTLKIKPGDSEKDMVYSDDPDPSHVLISGLKVGKGYKLTFTIVDAKAKSIQVSLAEDTAAGSGMPDLKVVFVNDSNGKVISTNDMTQTKKGIYEYVFTPTAESTLTYYVTDGNYLFWKADGSLFSTKLDSESEVLSNIAELSTVTTAKRNGKFVPYIINVDATGIPALVISAEEYDTTILAKAGILGINGWGDADEDSLTKVDDTTYTYEFTSSGASVEFAIRETAGSWSSRWFAGIPTGKSHAATASLTDDIVAAKVSETAVAQNPVYYADDPGMDGKNLKITGLPYVGNYDYVITIKIVDPKEKKLAISCKAKTDIPASAFEVPDSLYKVKGISYVCSNLGNYEITWGAKQSDGSYIGTVTIPTGAVDGWTSASFQFGVTNTTSWGVKFTGATLSVEDTYVAMTEGADVNNKIPAVSTSAATTSVLVITIKSTEDTLSVKYTY
jgi:hypothetical protein